MGVFAEKPVRAIAVDLPNLCIKTDADVRMGRTRRPPLLLVDILHVMRDLEALDLGVPIFYLIDHHVNPHAMTNVERQVFRDMEDSDISHPRKIWRMRRRISKADTALCALLNERSVAVLTEDRFRDEIEAGRLQEPHRMIRFHPIRDSRDEPYRFLNMSQMIGGDLSSLAAVMNEDEFDREWRACAQLLSRYMGMTAGIKSRRSLRDRTSGTNGRPNDYGEATEDEIKEYLERSAEAFRTVDDSNQSWAALREIRTDIGDPAETLAVDPPDATLETVRARRKADAVFLFLKAADLRKHQGQNVEVIARTFVKDDVVQFRLYAAGLSLTLELKEQPAITTSHMFASATGLLEYDGRDWVLRDATWNGVVDNARVQAVARGGEPTEPPRFSSWGRWPHRARKRPVPPPPIVSAPTAPPPSPHRDRGQPVTVDPIRTEGDEQRVIPTTPASPPRPSAPEPTRPVLTPEPTPSLRPQLPERREPIVSSGPVVDETETDHESNTPPSTTRRWLVAAGITAAAVVAVAIFYVTSGETTVCPPSASTNDLGVCTEPELGSNGILLPRR